MNSSIKVFFLIGLSILFSSCCNDISKDKSNASTSGNMLKGPAKVTINKSIVTATIEEILLDGKGSFKVKALITKVEEDPAYTNMAMEGETYVLVPNFQLDDEKRIMPDSEKNKKLSSLSKQEPGTDFKAVIFFENLNGWFIQEVL
jgi:hypothetical protein